MTRKTTLAESALDLDTEGQHLSFCRSPDRGFDIVSFMATVGRNEPCRCGSGRKFKRCCGAAGARIAEAPEPSRGPAATARGQPQFVNADGESILFTTSTWEILDLEALVAELSKARWRVDLDVERDSTGKPTAFSGHQSRRPKSKSSPFAGMGEPVVVATFLAERGRLTVETNSRERDTAIWERLSRLEPETLRYLETRSRSYEAMRREPRDAREQLRDDERRRRLLERPEVRRVLQDRIRSYSLSWCDQAIPALERRRPRQLVRSAKGRERVLALLESFEREDDHPRGARSFDTDIIRSELGLPPRRAQ